MLLQVTWSPCLLLSPDLGQHSSQMPGPNLAPFPCPLAAPRGTHVLLYPRPNGPGF